MDQRRNDHDVTNRINVTRPEAVRDEVCRLFADRYAGDMTWRIEQAFADAAALFRGDMEHYRPCETPYHDLQHTLDVTLAMARLLHAHEQHADKEQRLGPILMQAGIIVALFHDSGYMRRPGDEQRNGAAYTVKHVSRSARFLNDYLPTLGMGDMASMAGRVVQYTGYEMRIDDIPVHDDSERRLGSLVGTADLLAQMADRCYLEKCRDRLYYEFMVAGIAGPEAPDGPFASRRDLLCKTPGFISHAIHERMNQALGGVHRYSEIFFLPQSNLYWQNIRKNLDHISAAVERNALPPLRRNPPWTLSLTPRQLEPDFTPTTT